jgi:hypothetical protein
MEDPKKHLEQVGGYKVPVKTMDDLQCVTCQ